MGDKGYGRHRDMGDTGRGIRRTQDTGDMGTWDIGAQGMGDTGYEDMGHVGYGTHRTWEHEGHRTHGDSHAPARWSCRGSPPGWRGSPRGAPPVPLAVTSPLGRHERRRPRRHPHGHLRGSQGLPHLRGLSAPCSPKSPSALFSSIHPFVLCSGTSPPRPHRATRGWWKAVTTSSKPPGSASPTSSSW